MRRVTSSALLLAAIALALVAGPISAAPPNIVVKPSALNGWSVVDSAAGGSSAFIADGTAPAGVGALQLTTDNTNPAKYAWGYGFSLPLPALSSVTELSYYTKRNAGIPEGAASYQLPVLLEGNASLFTTLVFEPYWNMPGFPGVSQPVPAAWTSWDVDAGQFWSSSTDVCTGGTITNGAGGPPFYTLAAIEAACPGTTVLAFGVKVGSFNPSYDVEVDLVSFNEQAYDFEPETACTTVCYVDAVNGDDSFGGDSLASAKKTIQGGIDAVDPNGTVRVNDGTYAESPDISKSLTLESINGRNVTTIELQTGPPYLGSLRINGDDVTVDGFTIAGRDGTGSVIAATNVYVEAGLGDINVINNLITVGLSDAGSSTGDDGFGLVTAYSETNDTESLTVTDNIIEPLTTSGTRAFYINPGINNFVFQDNQITGNFTSTSITQAKNGTVADNTLTGTGSGAGMAAWGYPDPDVWGQTTFSGNNISAVANGITVYETNNVDIHHNVISAATNAVRVLDLGTFSGSLDPTSVHVNRNSLAVGGANTGISADAGFSSDVDGSCNWWGHFTGPGAIASGSGSMVTSNVEYSPWLQSSNLNAECSPNGSITIILQTHPEGPAVFNFTGTNGISPFTLYDDGTLSPNVKKLDVPAGQYTVKVAAKSKWALIGLSCDSHQNVLKTKRRVTIDVHSGEDITCTFTESLRKPDAMIATASVGPFSGDNLYNGKVTAGQTLAQSFAPGETKSFWVKFQNDGLHKDNFRVASKLKGSLKYSVVFMYGNVEITGKVKADTYKFTLAPGASRTIEMRVTADAALSGSDVRNIILTMQSRSAPKARDTVRAHVQAAP